MSRIVYVNGEFVPEAEARISVFDRGFLFADGVYEVTAVLDGRLVDFEGHLRRLHRSLGELRIAPPRGDDEILSIHRRLVVENAVTEGTIYMQVTRGAADRDFAFPPEGTRPSLVLFTQARALVDNPAAARGMKIASVPDLRWARRDIKTVQLLYPSLAKMQAKAKGSDDAWLVQDGFVTEGSSNNAYIVTADKRIVTRDLSHSILHGITRDAVLRFATEAGISVEERAFTVAEAQGASEAFITAASAFVLPVVEIDGVSLGDGTPGPVSRRLREISIAEARKSAI